MTTRSFPVVLEWDEAARLWVTYVPALNFLSTDGTTREEALANTQEAILGYLEAASKEGLEVPGGNPMTELVSVEVQAA